MDHNNSITNPRKNKHLNFEERMIIQIRLKDGFSAYKIAKELSRPINTILNEIKRGTVEQIKAGKRVFIYYADTAQNKYKKNRINSAGSSKFLKCFNFIMYVSKTMKEKIWSPDATVVDAKLNNKFSKSEIVSSKTIYNYIDKGLLSIKNIDLPMKLRRSNKSTITRTNKKILGNSINDRPASIDERKTFGHWEIDSVIGQKTKDDNTVVTIVERMSRYAMIIKVPGKTVVSVTSVMENLKEKYGQYFSKIFRSITSDNGSEFSSLADVEKTTDTAIYFSNPYSSWERGTNERHNGLFRRFIPKGKRISDYTEDAIFAIEEWMNTLPRKILGYKTPEDIFEKELDEIYSTI